MRKPAFCTCKNKGADQLCSYCTGDQHLCFRYTDSTIPLQHIFKISSVLHSSVILYRLVCAGPGRNPKLLVFSCSGSYVTEIYRISMFICRVHVESLSKGCCSSYIIVILSS